MAYKYDTINGEKYKRQANLFAFILEKGLNLLKITGTLSFIIPHSIVRAKGYEYIRKYIFDTGRIPYHIVDEGDAFTNVTLEMVSIFITNRDYNRSIIFKSKKDNQVRTMPYKYYIKNYKPYLYWDKITEKVIKYEKNKLWGFRGLPEDSKGDIILLSGKSTKKYYIENIDLLTTSIPKINSFFIKEKKLDKEEIVITQFGVLYPRGTIINTTKYCASGGNVVVKHNKDLNKFFVLGLLNSSLISYFFYRNILNCANLTIHLDGHYLKEIPIPSVQEEQQNKIAEKVSKILSITKQDNYIENINIQNRVREYEEKINVMIYKLYELTYEEVLIIDKDFKLSEEEYTNFKL